MFAEDIAPLPRGTAMSEAGIYKRRARASAADMKVREILGRVGLALFIPCTGAAQVQSAL